MFTIKKFALLFSIVMIIIVTTTTIPIDTTSTANLQWPSRLVIQIASMEDVLGLNPMPSTAGDFMCFMSVVLATKRPLGPARVDGLWIMYFCFHLIATSGAEG